MKKIGWISLFIYFCVVCNINAQEFVKIIPASSTYMYFLGVADCFYTHSLQDNSIVWSWCAPDQYYVRAAFTSNDLNPKTPDILVVIGPALQENRTLVAFNSISGEVQWTWQDTSFLEISFSADGAAIIALYYDSVVVYDVITLEELSKVNLSDGRSISVNNNYVAVCPEGLFSLDQDYNLALEASLDGMLRVTDCLPTEHGIVLYAGVDGQKWEKHTGAFYQGVTLWQLNNTGLVLPSLITGDTFWTFDGGDNISLVSGSAYSGQILFKQDLGMQHFELTKAVFGNSGGTFILGTIHSFTYLRLVTFQEGTDSNFLDFYSNHKHVEQWPITYLVADLWCSQSVGGCAIVSFACGEHMPCAKIIQD